MTCWHPFGTGSWARDPWYKDQASEPYYIPNISQVQSSGRESERRRLAIILYCMHGDSARFCAFVVERI